MNANLLEYDEAPVLTNEAIEVHLSYLRPAVEAMQGKIEALDKKLDAKIAGLDTKIDALDKKFDAKVDALDKSVNGRIDKLIEQLSGIRASQDGLKWFIGSLTLIASGASVAHSLGWV